MKSDADYRATPNRDRVYPYLGNYSDPATGTQFMVLFYKNKQGVVVDAGTSAHRLGDTCNYWWEDRFTCEAGNSVTLTND